MKTQFYFFILVFFPCYILAQNVGIGTTTPNASAMLDISANNKGILIPQVSMSSIISSVPVSSPANGLLIYNTATAGTAPNNVTPGFYLWQTVSSSWKKIITEGEGNVPKGSIIFKETDTPIAGYTLKGKTFQNDFKEFLGIGSGTWSNIPAISTGNATSDHSAVWTGTSMIIWSGLDNTYASYENTGAKYNPSTNLWTNLSIASAPVGRYANTAIWDDIAKRMLVWGGVTANNASGVPVATTNTGGIYNELANTWDIITTVASPAARFYHSAVWTGSKMIVWGGKDISTYYNDGSAYTASTNTWSVISASPLSTRSNHACVWTGSKIIIWGGENNGTALNDGAIYDVASNTWSTIASLNAPNALYNTRAVWTGTEMILIGGNKSASNTENRIYKYNPTTNLWSSAFISLPGNGISWNGSIIRHAIVWTGTEVIIYGGQNFLGEGTDMCYRFNPTTNVISYYANSPYLRLGHSVVWTGSLLLAFGGSNNPATSLLNNGYELDPATGSSNVYLFPLTTNIYMFKKD